MQIYYLTISCFCKNRSLVVYLKCESLYLYLTKWRRGLCGKIGSSHTGPEIFRYLNISACLKGMFPYEPWNIPILEYSRMLGRNVPTRALKYSDIWIFPHGRKECSHRDPEIFWYLNSPARQAPEYTIRAVSNFLENSRRNLPPVSLIGGAPWLTNISANFRKKLKRSSWDTLGLWETDSWKEPEAKNLVTLSL